jgi:antitoxin (DNA-binding transcriptional repressor) of toxin-antitoxin stability system
LPSVKEGLSREKRASGAKGERSEVPNSLILHRPLKQQNLPIGKRRCTGSYDAVLPACRSGRCGEEIIIAKAGMPVARLVPYRTKGVVRQPGTMRGKIRIKKNFDEPLPKEISDSFAAKT